jgi:cardiolipin synthase
MWTVIVITALVAALAIVIATNFHKPEKSILFPVEHCHAVRDPQFRLEMDAMLGPNVLEGNRITALQNGDEIFPAMLAAIRSATRTITFETYIYWSGKTGKDAGKPLP